MQDIQRAHSDMVHAPRGKSQSPCCSHVEIMLAFRGPCSLTALNNLGYPDNAPDM